MTYLKKVFYILSLAGLVSSCASYKTQFADGHKNVSLEKEEVIFSVYLIGDAGNTPVDIIHVKSRLDLQRALIISKRWAVQCGMRWALSKGKSEVLLPSELALQYEAFPFAGGQITTVTQARYLGVVLSANGILECTLKNRIQMSHASLSALRNAKLIFPGVDPTYAKMVYRTLIESKTMQHFFVHPAQMHYTPLTACCKDASNVAWE